MKRTQYEFAKELELNDADLALVQGGAQLSTSVADPTPTLDEKTLRKLHEQLNQRGLRGA